MSEPIDLYLAKVRALVDTHGLAIQGVGGGEGQPAFAYTVGLHRVGHPELIMFGLPMETAKAILNDAGFRIIKGLLDLEPGDTLLHLVRDYPVLVLGVRDSTEHLTVAGRIAGAPVPALQLIFPDDAYRWPWDPGSKVSATPLLGTLPDRAGRVLTLEEED